MLTKWKKGDITLEHVVIAILVLAVVLVVLIYSGILKGKAGELVDRIIDLLKVG